MSTVVQLKGANGSGKTTIIKQLIAQSTDKYLICDRSGKKHKPYATILYDLQWAIVGHYPEEKGMGGCDNIHTVDEVKAIVLELVNDYPDYWVVLEGMMLSTTMTMYRFMLELKASHGVVPKVVVLQSSLAGCLRRLEARRGSPLARTDLVGQKCEMVMNHQYEVGDVVYLNVDNIAKNDMLVEFLKIINDESVLAIL